MAAGYSYIGSPDAKYPLSHPFKIELPSRIESFRKQNNHQNQGGMSHEVFF
jgi:hypothetical protein